MLRHRVIPLVLLDGYSVVKTIRFDVRRNLGNPIVISRIYNGRNVDELILLDIDASKEGRGMDLHTIDAVASECFMPLTVGGGIRTCRDIEKVLAAGADKVSMNTALFEKKEIFGEAVKVFGSQCIVASLDVKKGENGDYELHSHAGRPIEFPLDDGLKFVLDAGVGEILLNNVDRDGMMCGFDEEIIRRVVLRANIPVIVAGGAQGPSDFGDAVEWGASAVAAASIFHFSNQTPRTCKEGMAERGIPVRL